MSNDIMDVGLRYFRSIDHIVPRSRGGSNKSHNCLLACRDCNSRRGSSAQTVSIMYINAMASGNHFVKERIIEALLKSRTQWALEMHAHLMANHPLPESQQKLTIKGLEKDQNNENTETRQNL